MGSSGRARDVGALNRVSAFLSSFPHSARWAQRRKWASLDRVREDGALTVRVEPDGDELVVRACGELDIASAKKLEDELRQAIESDASAVVLDLGSLSFVDPTGVRVLLSAAKLSAATGTPLRMIRATAPVRKVIKVSGLKRSLSLAERSALARYCARRAVVS
jgi:anti-sigma B factor antagonist